MGQKGRDMYRIACVGQARKVGLRTRLHMWNQNVRDTDHTAYVGQKDRDRTCIACVGARKSGVRTPLHIWDQKDMDTPALHVWGQKVNGMHRIA